MSNVTRITGLPVRRWRPVRGRPVLVYTTAWRSIMRHAAKAMKAGGAVDVSLRVVNAAYRRRMPLRHLRHDPTLDYEVADIVIEWPAQEDRA